MESVPHAFWKKESERHRGKAYRYGVNPDVRYPQYEIRRQRLHEVLQSRPKGRLLDAGCGTADVLRSFLDLGWDGYGVDFAEKMVTGARQLLSEGEHDPQRVRQGTIDDLSAYDTGTFDAVISMGVLAYVSDETESRFLAEAHRILKPGGLLLVHNINALFDLTTFNRITLDFFEKNFLPRFFPANDVSQVRGEMARLLTNPEAPDRSGAFAPTRDHAPSRQGNPLTYANRLAQQFGFKTIDQIFVRFHATPPLLFEAHPDYEKMSIAFEREYCRDWIGYFLASGFITVAERTDDKT